MNPSRSDAIATANRAFDERAFHAVLARRVSMPTESQNPQRGEVLRAYLSDELGGALRALGFETRLLPGDEGKPPFLLATRHEDANRPTVLGYGHADVIRGLDSEWRSGLSPWSLTEEGERLYGRGTADNKGQHTINLMALEAVLATRGKLGFNAKFLFEAGEEIGSPGLARTCREHRDALGADVLIASDGPRLQPQRPTIFLGARGVMNFDLVIDLRPGAHHSGNWGGLIADPGIRLAHALASITDARGAIRVPEWRPGTIPDSVRRVLAECDPGGGDEGPTIDPEWGEPGLTPAERVFGWCSFAVLAAKVGNPAQPVNAIAGKAWARCQLRFVVGIDAQDIMPALQRHLLREGFPEVRVEDTGEEAMAATRLDPDAAWVRWAISSLQQTTGRAPAILPNLGGSLPNDVFSEILGLPTIWVPHSYAACSQHAPNEHMLSPIAREGLGIMAGLYFDLGESDLPI